ncbi:hypothetical protein [Microbacterium oleivorans]|uniref:Uncharacterized protein n=1 Tax=Microbacterium oleivorans TaxID=273677 RepID=A0A4R5YFC2_9MICO|nr:hypothetical protein [Microbacterium oleivorans]TDL43842.1 hypothetical protein E2R54_11675 [Microbacterium oleivorans]
MAMSDEERRAKERERKARQRAEKKRQAELSALPRIGPTGRDKPGTQDGTPDGTDGGTSAPLLSNEAAAVAFVQALDVPASAQPRVALLYTLARDLDSGAVAQRSAIAQRYDEVMDKLIAAAKPREHDELDDMRRRFYTGSVDDIDDDPEAPQRRPVRKKA